MYRTLVLILVLVATAVAGVWLVYGELLMVGATFVINLIKGISLQAILAWLLAKFYRWLLVEPARALLQVAFWMGLPRRYRHKINWYKKIVREYIKATFEHYKTRLVGLVGETYALVLAVIGTTITFVIALVVFGSHYFVWIVGGTQALRGLILFLEWSGYQIQNVIFRMVMASKLYRLWNVIVSLMPTKYYEAYRVRKFGLKRSALRRKNAYLKSRRMHRAEWSYEAKQVQLRSEGAKHSALSHFH